MQFPFTCIHTKCISNIPPFNPSSGFYTRIPTMPYRKMLFFKNTNIPMYIIVYINNVLTVDCIELQSILLLHTYRTGWATGRIWGKKSPTLEPLFRKSPVSFGKNIVPWQGKSWYTFWYMYLSEVAKDKFKTPSFHGLKQNRISSWVFCAKIFV